MFEPMTLTVASRRPWIHRNGSGTGVAHGRGPRGPATSADLVERGQVEAVGRQDGLDPLEVDDPAGVVDVVADPRRELVEAATPCR